MYGKVFESMYDGTLASRGPWQALVTFQQMIVLANKDGIVDMTPDAIARRTSIPLEIIELGIAELMKPDARSRTPDEDGRRILLIEDHRDWGWQIVNHAKYQAIRKAEERREYLRNAQAERRNRLKEEARLRESVDASTGVNKVNTVSAKVNMSTPVSVDVSVYEDKQESSSFVAGTSSAKASPTKRGTRLPQDWVLPKAWGDWALNDMPGWTADVVRLEAAKFADFWHAKAGKDASKLDWSATWRNWCRNAKPSTGVSQGSAKSIFAGAI